MTFSLTSTAFSEGNVIPAEHTCDGTDRSPPLAWTGVPKGALTLALIADDPDAPAGTFTHWVLYDIPATLGALPENVSRADAPKELGGGVQGKNDSRKPGYAGPCPPPGPAHRYVFKLYALATKLGLKAGASKQEVERAMAAHVLATAQLMGRYARRR